MATKKRSFEQALERLEEIVEALEEGEPPLADAIKLYEEGSTLAAHCRTELERAELKVTALREKTDGTEVEEEFSADF